MTTGRPQSEGKDCIEGNFVTAFTERQIVKLPSGLTLAVQLFLASVTGAWA